MSIHQNLAAHFQQWRRNVVTQRQRNGIDGPQIGGDIFPGAAVTTRGSGNETAVFILQADGQAIIFELAAVGERLIVSLIKQIAQASIEGEHLVGVHGIAQRQHGLTMPDLGKRPRRRTAHPLGWRVGVDQFRVSCFECNQTRE